MISNKIYSKEDILKNERQIFEIINYKLPFHSVYECVKATLIATDQGTLSMLQRCKNILDTAYLKV